MKQRVPAILFIAALGLAPSLWGAAAADLATVNGRSITPDDLREALSGLNDGQKETFLKDPVSSREILDDVIDQELLVQQAEKEKVEDSQDFKRALKLYRRQLLANLLVQKKLGSKLTEGAARKHYSAHRDHYTTDQVHAQHILVASEAQARTLLADAKKSDADFQALARKHSIAPNVDANGGDMGFFTRDQLDPAFTDAVFRASAGQIIGPVKTMYGYHVVKVIERKPGGQLEYDEVELKVMNALRQDLIQDYVGQLKQGAKIVISGSR